MQTLFVDLNLNAVFCGERFFNRPRFGHQATKLVNGNFIFVSGLLDHPFGNRLVKVISTKSRIAAGCQYFKHALIEPQKGNIKSTAAQVINRDNTLGTTIQSIGHCRSSWFIEQPHDV